MTFYISITDFRESVQYDLIIRQLAPANILLHHFFWCTAPPPPKKKRYIFRLEGIESHAYSNPTLPVGKFAGNM